MDGPVYKIRRGASRSSPEAPKKKTSKYTQVCDNAIMTDSEKQTYGIYQNVGVVATPSQEPLTPSSTGSSTKRRHLQRTLSDSHCLDFVNSSEELLLKSVYDNMYNQNETTPDLTDVTFELRRYSPEYRASGAAPRAPEVCSPTQNIELICNCDLKDLYFPRPRSRQRYSSDQNIVHSSASRYSSQHKLEEVPRREVKYLDQQQQSLDRKFVKAKHYGGSPPKPRHTYSCEQNSRILQKIERRASSLRKQAAPASAGRTAVATAATAGVSSRGHGGGGGGDHGGFLRRADGQAYASYRAPHHQMHQLQRLDADERTADGVATSAVTTEFIRAGKPERYSGIVRSSTGSSRRGNLTSDSELDDDPELIFDLSAGHLVDCQCPCDHIGYSSSYHHLEEERCFPPAPDVTRRLQAAGGPSAPSGGGGGGGSGNTATGHAAKQEVTFYRSSSTPATCSNSSSSASGSSRIDLSTRHWWVIVTVLLLAAAAGVGVPIALRISAGASLEERMEFASRLLQEVPLIDGHNDLPWNIRKFLHNRLKDFKFGEDLRNVSPWSQSAWSHTDLPRLKQGHVAAQFWAAYVPCESQHRDAVQLTLEQIDVIRRFTEQYHPQLTLCTSAEEIRVAHQRHQLCSLIGVEGGHSLANSLAVLRTLYQVGVRYLTLTSTCNTPWADCSKVDIPGRKAEHGGLTTFGKTVVKEMNRLGMIVDLSHVSVRTMRDALAVSKAPVIFSHSSAHALCNSTRNVPDATLRKLALNRGIVMVNFYSQFLTCKDVATVADAVAHINHIRDVAGVDNVGLGAGYDGINYTPKGLEDVSSYPALFAELIGSGGWSSEDLKKLAGLNFLRVMADVERVRDEFQQAKVPPYEDLSPRVKSNNCSSSELF